MSLKEVLGKIERAVVRAEEVVVMTLLAGLAALQITQVLFRYVFNIPLHWVDESSRFIFILMVMVGGGLASAKAAQFSIDFIKNAMPKSLRVIADIVVRIGVLVFAYVLLRHGIQLAIRTSGQITASLQLPYTVPYSAMPLGGALILFHALMGIPKHIQEALAEK